MFNKLYGDGVHDDFPAIQEMLDSGKSLVYLPVPKVKYLIGKTLSIGSNQELKLDRYTKISLADNANCLMLENKNPEEGNRNITINGGIWDMNHKNQWPNPYHFPNPETGITWYQEAEKAGFDRANGKLFFDAYSGMCFRVNNIENFSFRNLTIENPVIYGLQMANVRHFLVENIDFDYTEGSPKLWNMDGIHVEGGCKHGYIHNLHGACHDDTVAITSDDSLYGEISDITVDGIYGDRSHSAVRLLSANLPVKNIHITNIYGTFYVYCITLSNYRYFENKKGHFENITVDNVYASFCKGTPDVPGNYSPLIPIDKELFIENLSIRNLHREETCSSKPTLGIAGGSTVHNLFISECSQKNLTNCPMPFLENDAETENLILCNVFTGNDEQTVRKA